AVCAPTCMAGALACSLSLVGTADDDPAVAHGGRRHHANLWAGYVDRDPADPAHHGVLRRLLRLRGTLLLVRRPIGSSRRPMVATRLDRALRRATAWHGPHRGIGRRRELRTGPSPAPSSLGFSAGGLPLADHVRSHGPVPADLPDREPDDAVSVGLGVLAIPRPS